MPLMLLAAAVIVVTQPPVRQPLSACAPIARQQAATTVGAAPHPLGEEPLAGRMHAVLRRVDGCVIVDVPTYRGGWTYRLAGPAGTWGAKPAGAGER